MPLPRPLVPVLLGLHLACNPTDHANTDHASTDHASTGHASTGHASTGHASTTTSEPTDSHASHASHSEPTSTDAPTGTTTGETGHDHTSTATTGHDTHDTHHTSTATTGEQSPVDAYCACMLENCHDLYHATWGEDHEASEAMCLAAAEALPSVGVPATRGNSIECRLHYCELGRAVAGACDSAIGGGACV